MVIKEECNKLSSLFHDEELILNCRERRKEKQRENNIEEGNMHNYGS